MRCSWKSNVPLVIRALVVFCENNSKVLVLMTAHAYGAESLHNILCLTAV